MNYLTKILAIILFLVYQNQILPQSEQKVERTGIVTFRSSENIYIKFESTQGLNIGDTLYVKENNAIHPSIQIKYLSQLSVAGIAIDGKNLKVDDKVYAFVKLPEKKVNTQKDTLLQTGLKSGKQDSIYTPRTSYERKHIKQDYYGRFSIQSFSNISNSLNSGNYQQWRYSFLLNADSISDGPFSISNYIIFTYKNGDLTNFSSNIPQNLKVYDLALKYNFDKTSSIWVGRHLNSKVANISSVDGLQYEQGFSSWYGGLIAGSRPDFNDLGFNLKLFEYGGYFGRTDTIGKSFMENTVSVMQQTNNMKTDRRFLYFQHSNNLLQDLSIFFSSEIDLYKETLNKGSFTFSPTGIFASAYYTPDPVVGFSLSYDARKDVIYYETYRSFSDSIIENETRQGFRAGINLRPISGMFLSLSAGYRYQPSDPKPAKNFNGNLSFSNIPFLDIVPSASYTKIVSSYIDGTIWGAGLSKDLTDFLQISVNYSNNKYVFLFGDLNQNVLSVDLSTRIWNKFFLNMSYEGTFQDQSTWGRFLLDLTTRF
jgi:hypothetical protein